MSQNIVTLQQAKQWMRYPDPTAPDVDDLMIELVLDGLADVIRFHCGDVDGTLHVERHQGGDFSIFTYHNPIVSVENLEEDWGFASYSLDFISPDNPGSGSMFAFSIDNYETGQLTRRTASGISVPFVGVVLNGLEVTYRAGYSSIPNGIKLAMLQLFGHLWANSQFRTVASSGANVQYDAVSGTAYSRDPNTQFLDWALPYAVIAQLDSFRRLPIIA